MPRSRVLTGRLDARDRARQRHRHDRRPRPERDEAEELARVIDAELPSITTIDDLERYDLTRYLRRTGSVELPPAERLRQLAIELEDRAMTMHAAPLRAWRALDRIYEAALRIDPNAAPVWASRAITASAMMTVASVSAEAVEHTRGAGSAAAAKMERAARRAAERAIELDPADAHALWVMGHLAYHTHAAEKTEEALTWFDRALSLDPSHASALLYRAHCLHDLKRWEPAVEAYDAVPLGAFTGASAWMVEHVVECRADCRLHGGDRDGALRELDALLERYESQPGLARGRLLPYLRSAARGELRAELGERFTALEGELERLWDRALEDS